MTTANPKDSIGLNVVRNEMKILAEQCTHVYGLEVTCIFEVKKKPKDHILDKYSRRFNSIQTRKEDDGDISRCGRKPHIINYFMGSPRSQVGAKQNLST